MHIRKRDEARRFDIRNETVERQIATFLEIFLKTCHILLKTWVGYI